MSHTWHEQIPQICNVSTLALTLVRIIIAQNHNIGMDLVLLFFSFAKSFCIYCKW